MKDQEFTLKNAHVREFHLEGKLLTFTMAGHIDKYANLFEFLANIGDAFEIDVTIRNKGDGDDTQTI